MGNNSKRVLLDDSRSYCLDCPDLFPIEEVNSEGYCRKCWRRKAREHSSKKAMSERKALFDATKELANQIAQRSRSTAVSPEFFDELSKELGGARGLGQRIAKDFKRIHGEGLSEAEQRLFSHDEKTIQRYWQTLMTFMQQQDRANAVDISSLSDKELQSTLFQLAKNLMEENQAFRAEVVSIIAEKDKGLIEQLAIAAGLFGKSIPGSVVEKPVEEQAKIEESPGDESDEIEPEIA